MSLEEFKITEHVRDIKDTTVDYNTWLEQMKQIKSEHNPIDFDGVSWIKDTFDIDRYMTGPVGLYKGKPIEARTSAISDFRDLYVELNTIKKNQQKFILYTLSFLASYPMYYEFDEDWNNIRLAVPKIGPTGWKLRYAVI